MIDVLLIGLGHVGKKHLHVLGEMAELRVRGIVDTSPEALSAPETSGYRVFDRVDDALASVRPAIAIVALPPNAALEVAMKCARAGAVVLVEKPVVVAADQLRAVSHELQRFPVFVAFQTHFASGLEALVSDPGLQADERLRATVNLDWKRHRPYYFGWRGNYQHAGGVLHQQAIHAIALAMRVWPERDRAVECHSIIVNRRTWKRVEDDVYASIVFQSGRELHIMASVDSPAPERHTLTFLPSSGGVVAVDGRNLEQGVRGNRPVEHRTHEGLRADMYRALIALRLEGTQHPLLYPLSMLNQPLEVIQLVYDRSIRHQGTNALPSEHGAV